MALKIGRFTTVCLYLFSGIACGATETCTGTCESSDQSALLQNRIAIVDGAESAKLPEIANDYDSERSLDSEGNDDAEESEDFDDFDNVDGSDVEGALEDNSASEGSHGFEAREDDADGDDEAAAAGLARRGV